MPRTKNEGSSIRTTAEAKSLLEVANKRECRSAASLVELLMLDYVRSLSLADLDSERSGRKGYDIAK